MKRAIRKMPIKMYFRLLLSGINTDTAKAIRCIIDRATWTRTQICVDLLLTKVSLDVSYVSNIVYTSTNYDCMVGSSITCP